MQTRIKRAMLTETVRRIGRCAFSHCAALEKVRISAGVEAGPGAFTACASLGIGSAGILVRDTMYGPRCDSVYILQPSDVRTPQCRISRSHRGNLQADEPVLTAAVPLGVRLDAAFPEYDNTVSRGKAAAYNAPGT